MVQPLAGAHQDRHLAPGPSAKNAHLSDQVAGSEPGQHPYTVRGEVSATAAHILSQAYDIRSVVRPYKTVFSPQEKVGGLAKVSTARRLSTSDAETCDTSLDTRIALAAMSKDEMVTTARSFVAGHQERGEAVLSIIQRSADAPALKISLSAQLIAWGFRLSSSAESSSSVSTENSDRNSVTHSHCGLLPHPTLRQFPSNSLRATKR